MGCNFTNAELPSTKLETRNSDNSNPGYDYTLLDDGPKGWRIVGAIVAVIACMLVAAVLVPK